MLEANSARGHLPTSGAKAGSHHSTADTTARFIRLGRRAAVVGAALLCLSACAKSSGSIDASYVSPLTYQAFTCDQLTQEYAVLKRRAAETFQQQDRISSNDSVAMGVGLILFWPALFFIDSSDKRHEVARMKGELQAVEDAATRKNCTGVAEAIHEDQRRAEQAKAQEETVRASASEPKAD